MAVQFFRHSAYGFEGRDPHYAPVPKLPDDGTRPLLARPLMLESLAYELRRYRAMQVNGRNCLVAGPRGSGKTTIVLTAHEEVDGESKAHRCRLIRVRLHGPSLLKDPAGFERGEDGIQEHVLKTVLINLYQTLCEELAFEYRNYCKTRLDPARREDALEMAAELRLTLDGAPDASAIRSFWEAIGAMPGGVLFPDCQADQGAAEIVALATASDAYRSCTGSYTRATTDEDSAATATELAGKVEAKGSELRDLITSAALTTGAAASAQYAGLPAPIVALAGVSTALLSLSTLSYTSSRKRAKSANEKVTFLPDLSVSSLVHRAPLILRRLRQAGIAPVFIVDELDKIPNLYDRLTSVVSHLKFITADQAFFCFLTDPAFLSQLAEANRERADVVQRTIFTNLLFLTYTPSQLREYLAEVIQIQDPRDEKERRELEMDAEALGYVLVNRARVLPFELVRAVAELRDDMGWLRVGARVPRQELAYQFHLMIQLAIEVVLSARFIVERIERDLNFAHMLGDALYYPNSQWYAGEQRFDCSAKGILSAIAASTGYEVRLSERDRDLLHERVTTMLDLVESPANLKREVKLAVAEGRMQVSQEVWEAVPEQPALVVKHDDDTYEWMYNRYGVPHKSASILDIVDNLELHHALEGIDAFVTGLATVSVSSDPDSVVQAVAPVLEALDKLASVQI